MTDMDYKPPPMPTWYREGQKFWDSFPPTKADFRALENRLEKIEAALRKLETPTE